MGYRELLRTQVGFRRLWLGQVVSQCGDWLQLIALLALFPTRGAGAEVLAGVFIIRMLPWIVWAPFAGAVADRLPRGRVMIACDLGRAAVVLGYLFVRGPEDALLIYALQFTQESLSTFFEPARSAALPQVVEPRALLAANSLAGATWSAMLAIGSALGGFIAMSLGARAAFLLDASSYLLSAVFIAGVTIPRAAAAGPPSSAAAEARGSGLAAIREGAAYLRGHGAQASAAIVKGLWGLTGGMLFLFSIYAGEIFTPRGGDPARATSVLYAGRGIGALIGPLIARRLWGESSQSLRLGIKLGFPLAALGYAALSLAPTTPVAALLLVVAHAGGSTCWVNSTQLLQLTVPNTLQGRVFAAELAFLTLTMTASYALSGLVIGRGLAGPRAVTLALAGAALLSAAVWALAMRRHGRALDRAAGS